MTRPRSRRTLSYRRRPIAGIALSFIVGVLLAVHVRIDPRIPLAAAALCVLLAVLMRARPASVAFLGLAVVLTGWGASILGLHPIAPCELSNLAARDSEYVEVAGVVCSDPLPPYAGRTRGDWILDVNVEAVHRLSYWQRSRGALRVVAPARRDDRYEYGDRRTWKGMLSSETGRGGEKTLVLHAGDDPGSLLSRGNGFHPISVCLEARKASAAVLARGLERYPDEAGLLRALMLGYRRELTPALRERFSRTGTLHIFAISGLHVGVMAFLFISVLKAAGISRQHWILYLGPCLVIYTLATGMKISAVRACLMALLFWSAPLFRRRPDGASALAAAALVILVFSPAQVRDPGFILSFTVVAGIMLVYPRISPLLVDPWKKDAWKVQKERWPRRALRRAAVAVGGVLAVSISAWIASAPLTAGYFNLFSPIALAGNLVIVPGAFLVVLTGCLSLLTGPSFPIVAEIFNHANRVFIDGLLRVVDAMASVPFGHCFVVAPPPAIIAAWYLAVFAVLARDRASRILLGASAIVLAAIVAVPNIRDTSVKIDMVDVGHGNAALVNVPGGGDVLVDAGPAYRASSLIRHLRRQGVDRLAAVVLTHADADHVGGAEDVMRAIPVDALWCPASEGRSPVYRDILVLAKESGIPVRHLAAGDRGVLAGRVEWEVLHPPSGVESERADHGTLVIRFARDGAAVLFTGGAGRRVEDRILDAGIEPAAPVVVIGDHGGRGTAGEAWLDALEPEVAVISVGAFNRDGSPHKGVLERLAERGIRVWRTDHEGGLRVTWTGNAREPVTLLPLAR